MTERNKLSELCPPRPRKLTIKYVIENGREVLWFMNGAKLIFTVSPDDIFDADGMRFENDLDYEVIS